MHGPARYFDDFEDFVNNIFLWIIVAYAALCVGALIFCFVKNIKKKRNRREHFLHDLGCALWLITLAFIVTFAIGAIIAGFSTFFGEQDYTLAWNYYHIYKDKVWVIVVTVILALAIAIGMMIIFAFAYDFNFGHIILALAIGVAGFFIIRWGLGFIIYVIIWFIVLVAKLIWMIISTFGVAMYHFAIQHWIVLTTALVGPFVLYTLIEAYIDYVNAFVDNTNVVKSHLPESEQTNTKKEKELTLKKSKK